MTDEEALEALRDGDASAMQLLVERHQLRGLRLAYQITRDRSSAEEVVAEAFVTIYQRIRTGRASGPPFAPWFTRIVVNRAISTARRAKTYRRLLRLVGRDIEASVDPEAEAARHERERAVATAMSTLPANERAALALKYYLDLDERGVAELLGWPLGTVKTRLHRGRQRLRRRLERQLSIHGMET